MKIHSRSMKQRFVESFVLLVFIFTGCRTEKEAGPVSRSVSFSTHRRQLRPGASQEWQDSLLTELETVITKYYSWLGLERPPPGTHERLQSFVRYSADGAGSHSGELLDEIGYIIRDISVRIAKNKKDPNAMYSDSTAIFLGFTRFLVHLPAMERWAASTPDADLDGYISHQLSRISTLSINGDKGKAENRFGNTVLKLKKLLDKGPQLTSNLERAIVLDETLRLVSGMRYLRVDFDRELLMSASQLLLICTGEMIHGGSDVLCIDGFSSFEAGLNEFMSSGDFEAGRGELWKAYETLQALKISEAAAHAADDLDGEGFY